MTPTVAATAAPTAILPNPQPNVPTPAPDTQPTPTPAPPLLPGQRNRVEVTLYQCPEQVDVSGDVAALLAACPQVRQNGETYTAFGESADDVGGVFLWEDLAYMPGQLIVEEEAFPLLGNRMPYPADPVVFCTEEGGSPQRMDLEHGISAIMPIFTQVSEVVYRCTWFKVPLLSDTLQVLTHTCYTMPPVGSTLEWYLDVCAPGIILDPMLADANGSRPSTNAWNLWEWPDLAFGPSGTAEVTLTFDQHPEDGAAVFCDGAAQAVTKAEPTFTVTESAAYPVRAYTCLVFGWMESASWDDDLQIPNTFRAETWLCPAGHDLASTVYQYRSACAEPAPGVEIAMMYPGDMVGTLSTSDANPAVAQFGLMGVGHFVAAPEPLVGHTMVGFCWNEGSHGDWRVDTEAYLGQFERWGVSEGCDWFFVPEAAGTYPSQADQAGSISIDAARLRKASRKRPALAS